MLSRGHTDNVQAEVSDANLRTVRLKISHENSAKFFYTQSTKLKNHFHFLFTGIHQSRIFAETANRQPNYTFSTEKLKLIVTAIQTLFLK